MTGQTTSKPTCPSCGAEVPPDAPHGYCLKCLFALGTAAPDSVANAASPSQRSTLNSQPTPLRSLGDYELLEEIARGGMGIIYKARQKSLGRIVAVKLLLFGDQSGKEQAQRFRAEAALAASLQHPNIVAIHEVSAHEGQPFFVMDFIEGQNLARLSAECEARNVEWLRRAARYVKIVAEAIHYAHERGILHRDLKPSNVLIDPFDQPRVTDFGLAKRLHHDSELTLSGQVLGSPNYMPPEQAAAKRGLVGRRSDVYSLGAILYHLLTGRPPFVGETLTDTLQEVVNQEPISPRLLNPSVPRDLETLCLKCLEKEPARRYQTAQALADDLDRFLKAEPMRARPVGHAEKLWRWCRRKPAVAAFATTTILLLLALAIGSPIAAWRIAAARNAERLQRERAEENADDLVKSLYAADMRMAWQALQEDNLLVARESVYRYLPALGIPVSGTESSGSSQSLANLHAGAATRDLLGWEWRRLWALCQSDEKFTLHGGDGLEIRCAVFSPDSRLVATARGRTVYVTDAHSKRQLATLSGFSDFIDNGAVAFSRDGQYLAAKGGTNVLIWEVGRWESPYQRLRGAANHTHGNAVLFSPDGGRFVTRVEGGLGVWDTTTWQAQRIPGDYGFGIVLHYTADGKWLAASEWNQLKILNAKSLEEVRILPRPQTGGPFRMFAMDSCPKRGLLAAGYRDGEVKLWETENWREVASFQAHSGFAFGLAFSPDGNMLTTGGHDRVIKFWDVTSLTNGLSAAQPREPIKKASGHPTMEFPGRLPSEDGPQPIKRLSGHHAVIHGLSFAPDGQSIISASKDGTAKFWNPFQAVKTDTLPDSERPGWFSPDGAYLITLNRDSRLHRWDTRNREDLGAIGPDLSNSRWTISDRGEKLALGRQVGEHGQIEIWDLKTGQRDKLFTHADPKITHLVFSQDAVLLAVADGRRLGAQDQATLRIWDTASGTSAGAYTNAFGPLAFSSDRQHLVSTRSDGNVVVWDLRSGAAVAEIEENFTWIGDLALSPDGRLLVTGSEEPVVNISELASGKRIASLKGSRICVNCVAFAPDAKTIATSTVDGAMKFWHTATSKEIFTVGLLDEVDFFRFSPNGEYLAISRGEADRGEQRMELWRAPSFEEIIAAERAKAGEK